MYLSKKQKSMNDIRNKTSMSIIHFEVWNKQCIKPINEFKTVLEQYPKQILLEYRNISWFVDPHWAHPFSVIHDDESKQRQSKARQSKVKARTTLGGRETGRETGQSKDVYKYTTNLQIVHIFKDPQINGSDWKGNPSSVVFD